MTAVQEARGREARRARRVSAIAQAVAQASAAAGAGAAAGADTGAGAAAEAGAAAAVLPRAAGGSSPRAAGGALPQAPPPAPGRRHAVARGVAPARPDGWAPSPRPRLRARLPLRVRRSRLVLISAGALVALLMFAVVAFHVVLTQRQFRLDSMQQELSQAQIDHAELTLKVAELESPARIVSVAMHRLHMVNPPRVVYLVPGDHPTAHKVSGVPAPAPAGTPFSTASSAPGR